MKRMLLGVALFLCLGATVARADDKEAAAANAKAILDALVKEDLATASKNFSADVKKALPPDQLKYIWNDLLKQAGAFKNLHSVKVDEVGNALVVTLTCEFEKMPIEVRVAQEGKEVVGLFLRPGSKPVEYKAPSYVKADTFREVDVTVNPGDWELPGTLTLPKGDGPFPVVILVHGSGPQDRDETIGPNKVFRDLAGGLATKGIAVLRYEKRTMQYSYKLVKQNIPVTINEEVVNDVLAAAALLRTRKDIDAKKIYLLGHSLGAYLAPLIAHSDDEALAGLILLAGNTRTLTELMLAQFDYLLSLEEKPSDEDKKHIDDLKKQIARLSDPEARRTLAADGANLRSAGVVLAVSACLRPRCHGSETDDAAADSAGRTRLSGDDGGLRGLEKGAQGA